MHSDGHLARLDTAFFRDQERRIYVQDLMMQNPTSLEMARRRRLLYVCGDAARMAKGVDPTLHEIVKEQGDRQQEAAENYIETLKDDRRYQRDVY
jgi:sulfite reductase (NADPH) flavoprotein alpha-component